MRFFNWSTECPNIRALVDGEIEDDWLSVWPFVEIKSNPNFYNTCQKINQTRIYLKRCFLTLPQKVAKYLGCSVRKIVEKNFRKWPNLVTLLITFQPFFHFCRRECWAGRYRCQSGNDNSATRTTRRNRAGVDGIVHGARDAISRSALFHIRLWRN